MKNIFIVVLILSSFQLFGRIEIANVFPTPTEADCLGSIQLNLIGTGGPFNVLVLETGEILSNVEGMVPIENLCTGIYTIQVSLKGFSNCEKILSAEILSAASINSENPSLISSNENGESIDDFPIGIGSNSTSSIDTKILISPNPNNGRFKIFFNEQLQSDCDIEIYSTNGQLIYADKISQKETNINLPHVLAGTYFIRFMQENELIQTQEIIVH